MYCVFALNYALSSHNLGKVAKLIFAKVSHHHGNKIVVHFCNAILKEEALAHAGALCCSLAQSGSGSDAFWLIFLAPKLTRAVCTR